MTKPTESEVRRTEMYRPEEVQEMFGIKKVAYYNRLRRRSNVGNSFAKYQLIE